jgi:hypothetical protein
MYTPQVVPGGSAVDFKVAVNESPQDVQQNAHFMNMGIAMVLPVWLYWETICLETTGQQLLKMHRFYSMRMAVCVNLLPAVKLT